MIINIEFNTNPFPDSSDRDKLIKLVSAHINELTGAPHFEPQLFGYDIVVLDRMNNYRLFFYTGQNKLSLWCRYVESLDINVSFMRKITESLDVKSIQVV